MKRLFVWGVCLVVACVGCKRSENEARVPSPLFVAVADHDLSKTMELLKAHPNLEESFRGQTLLSRAVQDQQYDIAEALLKAGAKTKPTRDGEGPMEEAARKGDLRTCKLIFQYSKTFDRVGCGPLALQNACRSGNTELVGYMLDHGAQINAREPEWHGLTPLDVAIYFVRPEVARYLLKRGAEPVLTIQMPDERNDATPAEKAELKRICRTVVAKKSEVYFDLEEFCKTHPQYKSLGAG